MDNRPIGVYDTGLGGLSAVKELQKLMPKENIFYFGDTARVPYGGRSPESIKQFAKECLSFLEKQNVKLIVVACGTVSSVLGDNIEAGRKVPCMGVLKPTAHSAVAASKNQKIGVIATAATVASGAYERKIKEESERALVYSVSCPLFVPLVECGRTKLGDEVTTAVAKDYFKAFEGTDIDTLDRKSVV